MTILTIEREGPVAVLRINRPEARNALGQEGDGEAIAAACDAVNRDPEVRCAILTGEGKAFSAGGDLKSMRDRTGAFAGGALDIREGFRRTIHRIVRAIHGLEMPLIAAVNGPAIGLGCDLATLADVRIAAPEASFGVPFVRIGLVPGDGGAWLLPRAIGMSRAAELFYSGRTIDAATAERWGLVSRIAAPGQLMAEARALALDIAQHPREALRMTKAMLRQAEGGDLGAALEASAANQALLCLTEDHAEGVRALVEGRPPVFRGS